MFLYGQGTLQAGDRFAVVVVGTRTMTQYGKLACQKLVAELVGAGVTILSGMAHGIDSVAHDTALRHGGRTVAVLAQGLAARESSHRVARRDQIAQHGAVLSEFPMAASPERYHYPTRNHTLAALGLATVVVEAAEKSGALITAEKALEENRDVFAVPGDVSRQTSAGTNALIRAGATLVRNGRDILEDLHGQLSAFLNEPAGGVATAREAPPPDLSHLSDTARRVLARVGSEPIHLDALHAEVGEEGVNIGALAAALLELETKGLVHHLPGNLYTTGPAL
jgi:DNA processing protein